MTPDLSLWLTEPEAAARLGISERTLSRKHERSGFPARALRPVPGRKPVPVYSPDDVATLEQSANVPTVLPASVPALRAGAQSEALARFDAVWFSFLDRLGVAQRTDAVPRLWLTVKEAAAYSGLSQAMLYRLCNDGRIVAVKDNGWKIRRDALDSFDFGLKPCAVAAIDAEFAE